MHTYLLVYLKENTLCTCLKKLDNLISQHSLAECHVYAFWFLADFFSGLFPTAQLQLNPCCILHMPLEIDLVPTLGITLLGALGDQGDAC